MRTSEADVITFAGGTQKKIGCHLNNQNAVVENQFNKRRQNDAEKRTCAASVMCKRTCPCVLALLMWGGAGMVSGEEKIDHLKIPWPDCGVGSNTGLPCKEEAKDIEREVTGVADEISQEDLDKFPELEEGTLKNTAPDTTQKPGN